MSTLKLLSLLFLLLLGCTSKKEVNESINVSNVISTKNNYVKQDQSELDISWWPTNYPIQKMQGDTDIKLMAKVVYSRPHKKGRAIFGETDSSLCVYGKPWRLGANEATEITFFEDVFIYGKKIIKGTYVIYCVPQKESWIIKLNTNLNTWGLHIDPAKDVFTTLIKTEAQEPAIENFTMVFEDNNSGANLIMAWDKVKAVLPIAIAK